MKSLIDYNRRVFKSERIVAIKTNLNKNKYKNMGIIEEIVHIRFSVIT